MYTSLDAKKLANLLDEKDEEEVLMKMMSAKMAGSSISRFASVKNAKGEASSSTQGLLDGEMVRTADLDFHIDGVRVFYLLVRSNC